MHWPSSISLLSIFLANSHLQFGDAQPAAMTAADCEGCKAYECLEKVAKCGPEGYLIAFGEKNCNNFGRKEIYDKFDVGGQKFINCTRESLLHFMGIYIQEHTGISPFDCAELRSAAFQSHPSCYLQCDFCQICKTNKWALIRAYDLRDFLSLEALKQIYKVISKCGIFSCFF